MSDSASTPTDKTSAAYLKRREQVRRAQRTHRERKESYIHALESEVLALRTKARSAEEHNNALALEVAQLRSQLGGAVKLDDCLWDAGLCEGEVEEARSTNANSTVEEKWAGKPGELPAWGQGSVGACSALVRRPREPETPSMSVRHADIAMEFVLTLEKPCIQRAQSSVFNPLNPYPLSYGSSNTELAVYHSFVEDQIATPASCTQSEVASSLENLLSLSSAFCLANEITPIQAWQQLCKYSEFGAVDMKGLQELMEAMLEHVRCYGFGAVISTSVFEVLCRNMFTRCTS